MTTIATQTASAIERFGFTLFFATALHAVAIIGITFTTEGKTPPHKTIEITLAQYQQKAAPKKADFIAQANQDGSGQSKEKHLPAIDQVANIRSTQAKQSAPQQVAQPQTEPDISAMLPKNTTKAQTATEDNAANNTPTTVITTTQENQKKVAIKSATPDTPKPSSVAPTGSTSLLARSLEIASLQAEIDTHREFMAKKPKIRRLTSASTKKREDALYLNNWRKKIESIGNLHYPEEARRNKMYGSLRLLVAIKPDGAVQTIEVLESSGQPVLDDAAIRIVRLAAPFQPFPVEMRKNTDLLEIIRTWKFEKKTYIY